MANARPVIPETYNRQDWPRLVARADRDHETRIKVLEAGRGAGTFSLDDGTATADGVFSFDDGGA